MVKREIIVTGNLILTKIFGIADRVKEGKRKKKKEPTAASVENVNRRNAERNLIVKLHANFHEGDLHVVLTYAKEPTQEEAKKELKNFIRRLRRRFKKNGEELKWISATEFKNKRIHHHLIMNYMDPGEVDKMWKAGHTRPTFFDNSGDYRRLASYLIKETDKTFREPGAFSKQRFSCSQNLITPDAKVEKISGAALFKEPKPFKGYIIDRDSVYKGVNPVTNIPFLEYTMISITPEPRLKRWNKGKRIKSKEKYYDALLHRIEEIQYEINIDK